MLYIQIHILWDTVQMYNVIMFCTGVALVGVYICNIFCRHVRIYNIMYMCTCSASFWVFCHIHLCSTVTWKNIQKMRIDLGGSGFLVQNSTKKCGIMNVVGVFFSSQVGWRLVICVVITWVNMYLDSCTLAV